VKLVRQAWNIPERIELPDGGSIVPLLAGQRLDWKIQSVS